MEKKYKSPKFTGTSIEILGWIFMIGMLLGIWMDDYRWKLIFTSLFAIFIASVLTIVDNEKEKKFNEENKK